MLFRSKISPGSLFWSGYSMELLYNVTAKGMCIKLNERNYMFIYKRGDVAVQCYIFYMLQ